MKNDTRQECSELDRDHYWRCVNAINRVTKREATESNIVHFLNCIICCDLNNYPRMTWFVHFIKRER